MRLTPFFVIMHFDFICRIPVPGLEQLMKVKP